VDAISYEDKLAEIDGLFWHAACGNPEERQIAKQQLASVYGFDSNAVQEYIQHHHPNERSNTVRLRRKYREMPPDDPR